MEQGFPIRLVTAYRESDKFDEEYIGRLAHGFYAHNEAEEESMRVVEDERWPGWWCKMAALEFIMNEGRPAYLADLDTIIIGPLPKASRFTVLHDFYSQRQIVQSGFMFVTPKAAAAIWSRWIADPDRWMREYRGDGEFIRDCCLHIEHDFWREVAPGSVVSFKIHCQHMSPESASVICYHGEPSPRETGWAFRNARLWSRSRYPDQYLSP